MTKPNLRILFSSVALCRPCRSQDNEVAIRRCLWEEDLDGTTCRLHDLPTFELERICERAGLTDLIRNAVTFTPSGERVPREATRETFLREADQCLRVKEMKSEHGGLAWSNALRAHLVEVMAARAAVGDRSVEAFAVICLARNYPVRTMLESIDEIEDLLDRGFREGHHVWAEWLERHHDHPEAKSTIRMLTNFHNVPQMISRKDEPLVLRVMGQYDATLLEKIVERKHEGRFTFGTTNWRIHGTMVAVAVGAVALSVRKLFGMAERGERARRRRAATRLAVRPAREDRPRARGEERGVGGEGGAPRRRRRRGRGPQRTNGMVAYLGANATADAATYSVETDRGGVAEE